MMQSRARKCQIGNINARIVCHVVSQFTLPKRARPIYWRRSFPIGVCEEIPPSKSLPEPRKVQQLYLDQPPDE